MRHQREENLLITCRAVVHGCWQFLPAMRSAMAAQKQPTLGNTGPTSYQQVFPVRELTRCGVRFDTYGELTFEQPTYAQPITTATVLKKVVFDYFRMKHKRLA